MRWEHDVFLLAVNECLAHWKDRQGGTDAVSQLETNFLAMFDISIENHASVLRSRVIRPPEVDELWTLGRSGLVANCELAASDCYAGWMRCGIYEELIETDSFSSKKTTRSAVMCGGMILEGMNYTCNDFDPLPYLPAELLLKKPLSGMSLELMQPSSWFGPLCAYGYHRNDIGRWPVVGVNAAILAKQGITCDPGRRSFLWRTSDNYEVARLRVWRSEPSGMSKRSNAYSRRVIGSDFIIQPDFLKQLENRGFRLSPIIINIEDDDQLY